MPRTSLKLHTQVYPSFGIFRPHAQLSVHLAAIISMQHPLTKYPCLNPVIQSHSPCWVFSMVESGQGLASTGIQLMG